VCRDEVFERSQPSPKFERIGTGYMRPPGRPSGRAYRPAARWWRNRLRGAGACHGRKLPSGSMCSLQRRIPVRWYSARPRSHVRSVPVRLSRRAGNRVHDLHKFLRIVQPVLFFRRNGYVCNCQVMPDLIATRSHGLDQVRHIRGGSGTAQFIYVGDQVLNSACPVFVGELDFGRQDAVEITRPPW